MRIEQLQAFVAVIERGSFQAAARACGVTQSTVSRQVQALEEDLGTSLLHRTNQVKLTLAGERLLPHARKICQEWGRVQAEISELLKGQQQELCIAGIHSLCAYYLPPVLEQFCKDYPQTQLRVTALGSDRALKVLKDGLVDVAIVMDNPLLTRTPEMVVEPLYEEPIHVLMAEDHPLSAWPAIPWDRLASYPQVVFKDGYGMRSLVQNHLHSLGLSLQAALELNTLDAFRGVVKQGNLVALLPLSAMGDLIQTPELTVRPTVEPVLRRQVVLVTTSDRQGIPPIQRFFQLATELIPKTAQASVPRVSPLAVVG
ncbi:MAG: LysR family transcriptional regulator [Cyanobacteriota bacterium]|nr:LysR family transcriptional regulator [Cyanobacteriota bacterium]